VVDPVEHLMSGDPEIGRTDALLAVHHGDVVHEHYGDGIAATTTLRSWSTAKSMLHAAVGMLVGEERLHLDVPAPVPQWRDPTDPRHPITLRQLLTMRPGLAWREEYADGTRSDVVPMLFGRDRKPVADTAAFAAEMPLAVEPGTQLNYSSGTSNIVSALVRDVVGPGDDYESWLRDRLFDPLGMTSATPRFDESGTWIASSYCFCTARDFARFGELYLREGEWQGERLLDLSWVRTAGVETGRDEDGRIHTTHWWLLGDNPWGAYFASGYLGQYVVVVPPLDLVVVRLGETATALRHHVRGALTDLIASFER
jgi:CubicO group peptidase (beta-lactamase class C family)